MTFFSHSLQTENITTCINLLNALIITSTDNSMGSYKTYINLCYSESLKVEMNMSKTDPCLYRFKESRHNLYKPLLLRTHPGLKILDRTAKVEMNLTQNAAWGLKTSTD
jgi:hypothetical protein